jgi:hypothetical protein
MVHTTPTKVLLTTTLRPLVVQLSGSLAQGVRLIQQCLREEPTPQRLATFERELSALFGNGAITPRVPRVCSKISAAEINTSAQALRPLMRESVYPKFPTISTAMHGRLRLRHQRV